MLHLGDDGMGSDDNILDEVTLPLSLSAGVLYIIQRFLNQVEEQDVSDEENWVQPENIVEVNLQMDDSEGEERVEEQLPNNGEGDMQTREPQVNGNQENASRRPRTKRYRKPWTRIRRSCTPDRPDRNPALSSSLNNESPSRFRSRSPLARDQLQPPPNEN